MNSSDCMAVLMILCNIWGTDEELYCSFVFILCISENSGKQGLEGIMECVKKYHSESRLAVWTLYSE